MIYILLELSSAIEKRIEYEYKLNCNQSCQPYEMNLKKGSYYFEAWGAAGGGTESEAGHGGYTAGNISFDSDKKIYVVVGCRGENATNSGYNKLTIKKGGCGGGGNGGKGSAKFRGYAAGSGGGGATSVYLIKGDTSSRIMVSAGGGGGYEWCSGGHAGGLNGGNSVGKVYTAYGATQTRGNRNGIGDNGYSKDDVQNGGGEGNCGCGGGYYGGKTSKHEGLESDVGGSGGSSYISVHDGCTSHRSGYQFSNTKMLAGNQELPLPSGNYAIGNYGDGYFRISCVKCNNVPATQEPIDYMNKPRIFKRG